jgi:hypothetical protein
VRDVRFSRLERADEPVDLARRERDERDVPVGGRPQPEPVRDVGRACSGSSTVWFIIPSGQSVATLTSSMHTSTLRPSPVVARPTSAARPAPSPNR